MYTIFSTTYTKGGLLLEERLNISDYCLAIVSVCSRIFLCLEMISCA
jgi:hypothetical protein